MINLELYRSFHAVAKTGSLTAAAKEMFISQPALSQSITNLENQLGGQLFVRNRKGMILTPEGERMYHEVSKALGIFQSAENHFLQMKKLVGGRIRIGASDTLCRHFLLKYITEFNMLYSDVNIQVTNRTTSETIDLLKAGQVDVAFVNLPIETQGLKVEECMQLNDCFIGNKSYKGSPVLSANDITKLPLVAMETKSNTRRYMDKFFDSLDLKLHPEIELGSFDLVVEFVKSGLGIGCVTREFVQKEIESGEIVELKTNFQIPSRAIGGITRKDTSLAFAAIKFIELVFGKS